MEVGFRNNEVKRSCEDEKYARKKYPDKVVNEIKLLMYKFLAISNFNEFVKNPTNKKYNVHELQGKLKKLTTLYLNRKFRMTVKLKIEKNKIIIWEISNHYGD